MTAAAPITLLIADDEPMILRGLCDNIPWESINVQVVAKTADGVSALHALETLKPDIAIVDICMPLCDGLTLIEKATTLQLDTTFIILSGYDDFSYAQRAIKCGVAAYLLKPINKQELIRTVSEQCLKRLQATGRMAKDFRLQAAQHGFNEAAALKELIMNIAVGHNNNEGEIRTALATFSSPFPFENVYAVMVDCPLHTQDEALAVFQSVLLVCPYVVFMQELDRIYIAVHIAPSNAAYSGFKTLLHEYVDNCREHGIPVCVSLGSHCRTLLELPLSLRAARNVQQYRFYELPEGVYDASLMHFDPPPDAGTLRLDTQSLFEAVLAHEENAISQQLVLFFDSLFYIPMPPPSFMISMCSYMIIDLCQRLTPYMKSGVALSAESVYSRLHTLPSVSALRSEVLAILLDLSNQMAQSNDYKYAHIVNEAKSFIDCNLLKKLLLSDVASHVHLSESYLAALFKSYTGQSFRRYLLERKMEKARELLLNEHKSIGEIAELLGYEDYRAFTRAFKKHVGTSPSRLCRKNEGRNTE